MLAVCANAPHLLSIGSVSSQWHPVTARPCKNNKSRGSFLDALTRSTPTGGSACCRREVLPSTSSLQCSAGFLFPFQHTFLHHSSSPFYLGYLPWFRPVCRILQRNATAVSGPPVVLVLTLERVAPTIVPFQRCRPLDETIR